MKKIWTMFFMLCVFSILCFNTNNVNAASLDNDNTNYSDWDFSEVIDTIDYFTELYPEKSETEIAHLVYDTIYNRQRYVGGLTGAEFWVIMNELGLDGFWTVKDLAAEAESTTIEMYGENGYQNDSDAFRHIYLTCILYHNISKNFAVDLMTAHESETSEGIDKDMDLHNNSRGIQLYEKWRNMSQLGLLKNYIHHCVYNGHIYNIIKIVEINSTPTLVYTEEGSDNSTYINYDIIDLTNRTYNNSMSIKDYQWYKFDSENKMGTFKVYSTGDVDLKVELYTSRTKSQVLIDDDDDTGSGFNFELSFEMAYHEIIYIKVTGYNDNKSGDYQITISDDDVTIAPEVTYLRLNKQKHIKVLSIDERIEEPHVVRSGSGRYTNCVLCNESLDTYFDGPFLVMWSKNDDNLLITRTVMFIQLTKEEWKKYVEGTYYDEE